MTGDIAQKIQSAFGMGEAQFARLVERAPYTYKVYQIPKKSGGLRTIAQPAKETKLLQRWLIANVFDRLPIHESASAYKTGASIKLNAAEHAGGDFLSKFDFKNFFPSISEHDICSHLNEFLGDGLSTHEIVWIARVACINAFAGNVRCLSVGAPSSPLLSNSIMFHFDSELHDWCEARHIKYTRYADDLIFSSSIKGISREIESIIGDVLDRISCPRLHLNDSKTIHVSKKHQRRVTGIIINNEGNLSLGRERKRLISALIHRFTLGQLSTDGIFRLQGLLGFSKDVEPTFILSMRHKYGSNVVDTILQTTKN